MARTASLRARCRSESYSSCRRWRWYVLKHLDTRSVAKNAAERTEFRRCHTFYHMSHAARRLKSQSGPHVNVCTHR